jgi:hypothetical protein
MACTDDIEELRLLCPTAEPISEAGKSFFLLPNLKLPPGRQAEQTDALLCVSEHSGYPTKLFLAIKLTDRGGTWREFRILDRLWYSWSWKDVLSNQRPAQILIQHLNALR